MIKKELNFEDIDNDIEENILVARNMDTAQNLIRLQF